MDHNSKIVQKLQRAIKSHQCGETTEAEKIYREILTIEPKHPDSNHNLGVLLKQKSQLEPALVFLKTALETNPNQGQFWVSYIDILIHLGQLDRARIVLAQGQSKGLKGEAVDRLISQIKTKSDERLQVLRNDKNHQNALNSLSRGLKSAIKLREAGAFHDSFLLFEELTLQYPDDSGVVANYAHLLLLENKDDLAYERLSKALVNDSDSALLLCNLARFYLKKEKTKKALLLASRALKLEPKNVEVSLVLASALAASGQSKKSLELIEGILKAKADYAEAYATRALLNVEMRDFKAALEDCEQALSIKPHLTQFRVLSSKLYFHQKNIFKSIESLEQVLDVETDNVGAMIDLGEYYRLVNDHEKAVFILGRAIEIAPEIDAIWVNYGTVLQHLERSDEAIIAYQRALSINSNIAEVHSNLGVLYTSLGQLVFAVKCCERAIEIKPSLVEAHCNLGIALKDLGRLDEAAISFKQAVKINPNYAKAYSNLGIVYKDLGQFDEAVLNYKKAINIDPSYAKGYNNIAVIYKERGQLEEALKGFKKALELAPDFTEAWSNLFFAVKAAESSGVATGIWLASFEKKLTQGVLDKPYFAMLNFSLNAFKPYVVDSYFYTAIKAFPPKTDEEISNPSPTHQCKEPVLIPEKIVALLHLGRSETKLLHSLIDSHREISTLPSIYFSEYYHADVWEKLIVQGWYHLPENFIKQFAVLFDARSSMPVPSIDKPLANLGQKEGMTNVGEGRDEVLIVDKEVFCVELKRLMSGYLKLDPKIFFDLVHVAYEKALNNTTQKNTIFYHVHNPSDYAKLNFLRYNPEARLVMMVREPVQSCESWLKKVFSAEQRVSVYNRIVGMLFGFDQIVFRKQDSIGVRLEDLKVHPKETMVALCNWMGIEETPTLYEMTAQGKKWWGDPSSPDYGKEAMSPFGDSAITRPVGVIFSEQDQFILRTLFYPFSVRFGYVEENLEQFKTDLQTIKPLLDEPFDFEKKLAEMSKMSIEAFLKSGSSLYFRAGLHARWEVLEEFYDYPYMLKRLIISVKK